MGMDAGLAGEVRFFFAMNHSLYEGSGPCVCVGFVCFDQVCVLSVVVEDSVDDKCTERANDPAQIDDDLVLGHVIDCL